LCLIGGKLAVDKMVRTTGGGATNVAVGMERLGLQYVRKKLRSEGVSLVYVQQVDKATSNSVILVGDNGGRSALVYRRASNALSWHKVEWSKLDPKWFYVSSLGGDMAMLTKIIREAEKKGIKVALNPGSKEIASRESLKRFLPKVEVLLLNWQEAAGLTKHKFESKKKVLEDVGKLGAKMVAVTEGRKGASLVMGREVMKIKALKVDTVEETGAGDGFGCGFVSGLIKWGEAEKALKLGVANGGSVTEYFGPKEGLLFDTDVEKKLKKSGR